MSEDLKRIENQRALQALHVGEPFEPFVAEMSRPEWDVFFMGLAYYYCTRSPDQQTKTGCVIVDWPSHRPIGLGYNGHPCKMDGLPTMREGSVLVERLEIQGEPFYKGQVVPADLRRWAPEGVLQGSPDKYPTMIHADMNAIVKCDPSEHAVAYLPFEPCENCLLAWLACPHVAFKRIVILTSRLMLNTGRLLERRPDLVIDVMSRRIRESRDVDAATPSNDPALALFQAAQYCNLMIEQSVALSKNSASVYRK